MFITIEGGEGVGKTTQIAALKSRLESLTGKPVCVTREPGGTWYAEKIRDLLLMTPPAEVTESLHADTELMLMFASRVQHYHHKILPELQLGNTVICSRFTDSSLAYQGGGRGLSLDRIRDLAEWALPGVRPDLTFLLDLSPQIGMARAHQRAELDRIETEHIEFFERVRSVYLSLAQANPSRYCMIAADAPIERITQAMMTAIEGHMRGV